MVASSAKWTVILVSFSTMVAPAFQHAIPTPAQAQEELFADRFENAAQSYSLILQDNPANAEAHYGLVRALLQVHRSKDAYAAAENALRQAPNTAPALTAAGMAAARRGELVKAEDYFRSALKLNPQYPGALKEIAFIYSLASMRKTAQDLRLAAYRIWPHDPDLVIAHANSLKGADHIAALEGALAILDPQSERAEGLRAHIGSDRAIGDRKVRQLTSPYQSSEVKLFRIMDGPTKLRGFGLRVQLNQRDSVRLLLDSGATGVSVSPKVAEKAGLEKLTEEGSSAKGLGDEKASAAFGYLAKELRVGNVVFSNYPVEVFRAAQSPDYDGLIGANVFRRFLVGIDFARSELSLETRPNDKGSQADEPENATGSPAPGFFPLFRFGDHLALPTLINDLKQPRLFLVDSGASTNLIDTTTARESTKVYEDFRTTVRGIQGKVAQTSRANRVSLVFAGFRQENADLIAIDLDKMGDQFGTSFGGIIGMPILSAMKLTIDYDEGTAHLDYKP